MRRLPAGFVLIVCALFVPATTRAQLIVNNDGTVTDTKTGLVWMRDAGSPKLDWQAATAWASGLTLAGGGWRLPAASAPEGGGQGEFGTLFWRYRIISYIPAPFTNITSGYYWTSESVSATNATAFYWVDPALEPLAKSTSWGVWAVRNAPGGPTNVPINLWVIDCPDDDGTMPSASHCSDPLASPHIFFDNDEDLIMDAPHSGARNRLVARVRNTSAAWAMWAMVTFYQWNCSEGDAFLNAPSKKVFGGPEFVSIPANGGAWVATSGMLQLDGTGNPQCFGVVVDHPDDHPVSPSIGTLADNNLAAVTMDRLMSTAGRRACPNYTRWMSFYLCGPIPYRRWLYAAAGIAVALFAGWAFGRAHRRRAAA